MCIALFWKEKGCWEEGNKYEQNLLNWKSPITHYVKVQGHFIKI